MSRRTIIVALIFGLVVLDIAGFYLYNKYSKQPPSRPIITNLGPPKVKDLSETTPEITKEVVRELKTQIRDLPETYTTEQRNNIENSLAVVLRKTYGVEALKLTAVARPSPVQASSFLSVLLDIPEKNVTYTGMINTTMNNTASVFCAPQEHQIQPDTSVCEPIPDIDGFYFPEG